LRAASVRLAASVKELVHEKLGIRRTIGGSQHCRRLRLTGEQITSENQFIALLDANWLK
jgi:hypothetical protein